MFTKIIFLLWATAVLSFKLGTTPEQLQTLIEQIDAGLKTKEHEAQIEIRDTYTSLNSNTNHAKTYIIENLTEAAKPYWDEITSLENEAADNGQDISTCLDVGNEQLYALNGSTVLAPIQEIVSIYNEGYDIVINSSNLAYGVLEEFLEFKLITINCSDTTCADELGLEAVTMYRKASNIIDDAINVSYEYSVTNLPGRLAGINIDRDAYAKNYTPLLEDIKSCINKQ